MTVQEGHILNLDGDDCRKKKYPAAAAAADRNATSGGGVCSNSLFAPDEEEDDEDVGLTAVTDTRVSIQSGHSGGRGGKAAAVDPTKLPWYKGITFKDVRDITPTLIILLCGLLIMIFVIPYAFSSVIKQLRSEEAMKNKAREFHISSSNNSSSSSNSNVTAGELLIFPEE